MMVSHLRLLVLSSLAAGSCASFQSTDGGAKASRGPAIVGAIRWDAYFATPGTPEFDDPNFGIVSRTTTYDMSPKKWHYRLPFFAKEVNDTSVVSLDNWAPPRRGPQILARPRLACFLKPDRQCPSDAAKQIVNGNSPDVMGQELEYARAHGINFWPFCNYREPPLAASSARRVRSVRCLGTFSAL